MMKVPVVGAGLAGCCIARRLAEKGHDVTLYEKESQIGGLCADYLAPDGTYLQYYGPHAFHTSDGAAFKFLEPFADWVDWGLWGGSYYLKEDGWECDPVPPFHQDGPCTLIDLTMEERELIDERYFREYSVKQWYPFIEMVAHAKHRIPIKGPKDPLSFHHHASLKKMPKHGYTQMLRKMIDHPNIMIEPHLYTDDNHRGFWCAPRPNVQYKTTIFDYYHVGHAPFLDAPIGFLSNFPRGTDHITRITDFSYFPQYTGEGSIICIEHPQQDPTIGIKCYPLSPWEVNTRAFTHLGRRVGRMAQYQYLDMDQVVRAALDVDIEAFLHTV
jgi:UDP-galactopyranose mutase